MSNPNLEPSTDPPGSQLPTTEALGPESAGRWVVRTRSTTHLFDLDTGLYVRLPGGRGQRFPYDGEPTHLTRIQLWPRVGARFLIWFDPPDPDLADVLELWHGSSHIASITAAPAGALIEVAQSLAPTGHGDRSA